MGFCNLDKAEQIKYFRPLKMWIAVAMSAVFSDHLKIVCVTQHKVGLPNKKNVEESKMEYIEAISSKSIN